MIEDKLTRDERRRLESLAQSIVYNARVGEKVSIEKLLADAKRFDMWVSRNEVMEFKNDHS